jgi:putative Holliday junction resolvase
MRSGVRLGVDVGKARIGVARCDPHAMLATPVETVPRSAGADSIGADLRRIIEIVREHEAMEVVVGLPLGLSGHRTPSTDDAESFAQQLARAFARDSIAAPVRLVDERLSTVSAQGQLRQAGRKTKQSRQIIDQAAAVVILQHAIDTERALGAPPGTVVPEGETGLLNGEE